jgi:hypothetical protein
VQPEIQPPQAFAFLRKSVFAAAAVARIELDRMLPDD